MKKLYYILFILIISFTVNINAKPLYIATSQPVKAILQEITGTKADIITLVSPGNSPHTYSPKPSQVFKAQKADALFYVSELLDGWASNLGTKNKYRLIGLLPISNQLPFDAEDSHMEGDDKKEKLHKEKVIIDPHFWTDPLSVKAIVPILVRILAKLDSANAGEYQKNGKSFIKKLNSLNTEISSMMKPYKGSSVFLFHPSFRYYLRRYGLVYQGSIEVSPGKEPTSRYINALIKKIKKTGAKAIFTEPQLPSAPAKMIAEAANLKIYTLDPNGGTKRRLNYIDLMIYNAETFRKALN